MDINNLSGENFLALSEFNVDMGNRGLVLIQGENDSDTSADSNGSGKSSLADALSWCLYGVTARGLSGDKIVSNFTKKNTKVSVELVDGEFTYEICRYRKHDTEKNNLFLYQISSSGGKSDLTKGTEKETQAVINSIVGCGVDVFNAAVYAGQEKMPNLPGMTDKNLKILLEEAAGTEELVDCYELARKKALEASKAATNAESALNAKKQLKDNTEAHIALLETASTEFEDGRRERAKGELAKAIPLNALLDELTKEIESNKSAEDILTEIADVKKKIAETDSEKSQLTLLKNKLSDLRIDANSASNRCATAASALIKAQNEQANIDSLIGTPCKSCGKTYCTEDMADVIEAQNATIKELMERQSVLQSAEVEALKAVEAARIEAEEYEKNMTDVSAEYSILTRLSDERVIASQRVAKHADTSALIQRIKDAAAERLKEPNPHTATISAAKAKLSTIDAEIAELQDALATAEEKSKLMADVVSTFSPAGVRAHILDLITPFLNEKTREYLGALSDGNISAIWSTLTKTAKGELKEKFNIEVSHELGGDSFEGLSGGEKRKVRLATAMALQEMVASRASKPINLFIADEIDDALDPAGLERLMGLLEKKAKSAGSLFIISHLSLADWVDTTITVKKTGKSSIVTGATKAGV